MESIEVNKLVHLFYAKEYKDYDQEGERLDSYDINGVDIVLHHHTKNGKELITSFTLWDVIASLLVLDKE